MGCELDLIPYMLKGYFGLRSFSTMYGFMYSVYAVAGGIAPLLLGYIYAVTGSYTRVVSIFSLATTAVGFGMLALPAYVYADRLKQPPASAMLEAAIAPEHT